MAVGASAGDILGLVVRQVALLVATGLVAGIIVSLLVNRYLAGLLFGVVPRDPATFAAAVTVLSATAVFAAVIPARRALKIDPVAVLRAD